MATAHGATHDHHAHDDHHPTGLKRWLFSTNHKDIGTMYLVFSVFAAIIGAVTSSFSSSILSAGGMLA